MGKNGTATAVLPRIAKELAGLDHAPVSSLEPFQGDLKELTEREYKKLKKSILENGLIVPFFVWLETGKLLDGHQRSRVFTREGWSLDVPVVYISADNEQDAKQKLLIISSQYGRMTQDGFDAFTFDLDDQWIKETLQFDALPFVFDFEETGGGTEEGDAEPQVNRAEELRQLWGVEPGQMWRLPSRVEGQEHRLICGDCTDRDVVARLMCGEVIESMVNDPPYGMKAVSSSGVLSGRYKNDIDGDDSNEIAINAFLSFQRYQVPQIWWGANYYSSALPDSSSWLVWDKNNGQSDQADAELAWSNIGGVVRIYRQASEKVNRTHPTQKHPQLIAWCLSKLPPGIVCDFFVGSGTTIIAAENLSRQCRAVEISPGYVAVALQRYCDAFNITPELITEETAVPVDSLTL